MECHSGTPFFVQVLRRSADDSHNTNECFIELNCYKYNDLFWLYGACLHKIPKSSVRDIVK